MSEGMHKTTGKNRASKEICMSWQNAKNQASKQTNNCVQCMFKTDEKCNYATTKTIASLILWLQIQNGQNQHRGKTRHKVNMHKKRFRMHNHATCTQSSPTGLANPTKPGQASLTAITSSQLPSNGIFANF